MAADKMRGLLKLSAKNPMMRAENVNVTINAGPAKTCRKRNKKWEELSILPQT